MAIYIPISLELRDGVRLTCAYTQSRYVPDQAKPSRLVEEFLRTAYAA
jgi:hypothetical protein